VEFAGEASPEPKSAAEVLAAHDDSVAKTKANLSQIGDTGMGHMWAMKSPDGKTVMTMPKAALVRSIALNHVYHHRGQLSVYLRLLDIPVPSIYGPSADEPMGMG
jgi:uncharacterized damage-inducible protein DinB